MTRATVFGLDVWSDIPLSYLTGTSASSTGRTLDVLVDASSELERVWPKEAQLIGAQPLPDGRTGLSIQAHPQAGYLLCGEGYGAHVLSRDGRRVRCMPDGSEGEDWQRFLIAQVLPFAAALNGLEVLHASAVSVAGEAVGVLGPSGAGKTSLALAMCRLGACFIADDVLALERSAGILIAHPGSPLAGLDHREARRIPPSTGRLVGVNGRERLLRMVCVGGPVRLGALFMIDRRPDGPREPCFEPLASAQALLASTFNLVLEDPDRLAGLLEVCALAANGLAERVTIGASLDSSGLARAIVERLGCRR